jgi:hypothetical protein
MYYCGTFDSLDSEPGVPELCKATKKFPRQRLRDVACKFLGGGNWGKFIAKRKPRSKKEANASLLSRGLQ